MREAPRTQLYTFYSYKGGVGRTMAVANAACQLANKHGKRVICIDWDLEAPGLHHYFSYTDEDLAGKPGLLDYLMDFVVEVDKGAKGKPPDLEKYLYPPKPEHQKALKFGSVRLMPCGSQDPDYFRRVEAFDWGRFYERQHGYEIVETFKKQLRDQADMTLIDARAGQADVGTVPTIQVPDAIVILFTSNRQSLHGMERMARSLHNHPQRIRQGLAPPKLLVVAARVFPKEERFQQWMDHVAAPVYQQLVDDGVVHRADQPNGLWQLFLPVDSQWSIDEKLVVLETPRVASDLQQSYAELARALNNLFHQGDVWDLSADRPFTALREEADRLRRELDAAVERGDPEQVAMVHTMLGFKANLIGRLDEAEATLQAALGYWRKTENTENVRRVLSSLGSLRIKQGRLDEAFALFRQALHLHEEAKDMIWQSMVLDDMANVCRLEGQDQEALLLSNRAIQCAEQYGDRTTLGAILRRRGAIEDHLGRPGEAMDYLERSLALHEDAGDVSGQVVTLMEMANALAKQGRYEEASGLLERALRLAQLAEDVVSEGCVLERMSWIRVKVRDRSGAREMLERALALAQQAEDHQLVQTVRDDLAQLTHHGEKGP